VKALVEEHLWLVPIVCKKYQKKHFSFNLL